MGSKENIHYSIDGPAFEGDMWTAGVVLGEIKSEVFSGESKWEVQEKILHFLGWQALEVEKVRILLRKKFESENS